MEYNILSILVKQPQLVADKLQNLFKEYGCIIRSRLGLNHNIVNGGIIILELSGDSTQIELFLEDLNKFQGIEYKHVNI
ncbi:MAG: hypothetical protein GX793_02650 [Bacteroidales bacterium]|jgi:hypothetical protein|nr:hypothetical protein [Bacteroidales bacterium]MCK9499294.1 hypothetical protein [Bacteroidales bacterium]MDY0313663.1 hypothetical protein [Bacteroidales bacterium]NLB85941.1 hypothetical protein [Bacteroidales bacterium]